MDSKTAAILGISQVTLSRIVMAAPGMTVLPVIMVRLEKKAWMQRIKPLHGPIQVTNLKTLGLVLSTVVFPLFLRSFSFLLPALPSIPPSLLPSFPPSLRPSVPPSFGPSLRLSLRPSVRRFVIFLTEVHALSVLALTDGA